MSRLSRKPNETPSKTARAICALVWRTVRPINTPTWVLERNPFYYAVDTEGQQLPYIDRVQMTLAEKVDLMTGNQGEAPYAFYNAPIPRLGIPALKMADAGGGVAPRGSHPTPARMRSHARSHERSP